jgi:hypothetical protein
MMANSLELTMAFGFGGDTTVSTTIMRHPRAPVRINGECENGYAGMVAAPNMAEDGPSSRSRSDGASTSIHAILPAQIASRGQNTTN